MPWRLILFVFSLVIIVMFAGFNLDNRCTISLGFTSFENVPVFQGLAISFLAGIAVCLPAVILAGRGRSRRPPEAKYGRAKDAHAKKAGGPDKKGAKLPAPPAAPDTADKTEVSK